MVLKQVAPAGRSAGATIEVGGSTPMDVAFIPIVRTLHAN